MACKPAAECQDLFEEVCVKTEFRRGEGPPARRPLGGGAGLGVATGHAMNGDIVPAVAQHGLVPILEKHSRSAAAR